MTDIRFLGHSCFELSDGESRVLIDPFLKPNNPVATVTGEEVDPTTILITHGHVDHLADAVGIAKRTGATCAAIVELANWLGEQGVEDVLDPNLGGTVRFDWGAAKLVQAWHTSTMPGHDEKPFSAEHGTAIGTAAGWVVDIGGKTVYHLGDTALFGDLKLIAERTPVDVALIPVGGHYTMDRHDAVVAAELIGASTVVPMHHSTFPPIETDLEAFKADVESQTSSEVALLQPGETFSV
ncbi:MAG TPA: metal-dependent hydrolase [Solirubrobacterales bacterium]|nr:metal-dependent hydrolase [Solirubrobacterales bacterium]